jgi:hypothetical protein
MDAIAIVGQVVGRMLDPIGWIIILALFFSFRAATLPTWVTVGCASLFGAAIIQIVVQLLIAAEGRHPDFMLGLFMWMLTGLVECGIALLIVKGIRAMKSA